MTSLDRGRSTELNIGIQVLWKRKRSGPVPFPMRASNRSLYCFGSCTTYSTVILGFSFVNSASIAFIASSSVNTPQYVSFTCSFDAGIKRGRAFQAAKMMITSMTNPKMARIIRPFLPFIGGAGV